MRRLYLRDSEPGDVVEDVFVISNKQLSNTNGGKHFIKAFVSDRSMQINARMWNATRDIFNAMPESGFLRVRGHVENYQNNNQLIIELLRTFGAKKGATLAQVALAWLMAQKPWIVPIPGTTKMDHLRENLDAVKVQLTPANLREIETAFSRIEIYGGRMDAKQMAQIGKD